MSLESDMEDFVRVGNYQQALTLYSSLRHSETIPTPKITRLAGRAAWGLGDAVSARNYLQKAFQGGLNAAGIELETKRVYSRVDSHYV